MEPSTPSRRKGGAGLAGLGLAASLMVPVHGTADSTGTLAAAPRLASQVVDGEAGRFAGSGTQLAPARYRHRHRPNILLITSDDASVQDMRYMPHLQKLLADRGVTFTDAIAPTPICVPARASLLTGQYAHNHRAQTISGVNGGDQSFKGQADALPAWLQQAGYDTLFVGKYLNGYGDNGEPVVEPGWTDWRAAMGGSTYSFIHTVMNYNGRLQRTTKYSTDLFTDNAVSMLSKKRRKKKPWYLWLNYVGPHHGGPRQSDDPQVTDPGHPRDWVKTTYPAHRDDGEFEHANLPRSPALFATNGPGQRTAKAASDRWMRAAVREGYQQRLEALQSVDQDVARIIRRLKATHQYRRTVIIFTSDNGFSEGDHNRYGKLWEFNQILRIPVMMTGPGVPHDKRVHTVISNPDIATTIAAIAKATPERPQDGANFMPILRTGYRERVIPIEGYRVHGGLRALYHGIRVGKWTYIRMPGRHEELYNLGFDRWELSNLARLRRFHGDLVWLRRLNWRYEHCAGPTCMRTYQTPARMNQRRLAVVRAGRRSGP